MPYETYGCSVCSQQAPRRLREHGTFAERLKWLRHHYAKAHPRKFAEWNKKSVKTKKVRR